MGSAPVWCNLTATYDKGFSESSACSCGPAPTPCGQRINHAPDAGSATLGLEDVKELSPPVQEGKEGSERVQADQLKRAG